MDGACKEWWYKCKEWWYKDKMMGVSKKGYFCLFKPYILTINYRCLEDLLLIFGPSWAQNTILPQYIGSALLNRGIKQGYLPQKISLALFDNDLEHGLLILNCDQKGNVREIKIEYKEYDNFKKNNGKSKYFIRKR